MSEPITGKTLIAWGFKPGAWFSSAITRAENMRFAGSGEDAIKEAVRRMAPAPVHTIPLRMHMEAAGMPLTMNIAATDGAPDELENIASVRRHMHELMRVPTIKAGTVLPDACPSGSAPGTIPVGGVVACENAIHPGFHSADICCSMAVTILGDVDPKQVLDRAMVLTHFGGGGRAYGDQYMPPNWLLRRFEANEFLHRFTSAAIEHFATQGDGNHFFYVGRVASSGHVAIVTHHGSRKPGAMLYRAGMKRADAYRRLLSPETPAHNAWIPADTKSGRNYWDALQTIREWTRESHFTLHGLVADAVSARRIDQWWNEHNFVFRREDGLYYHAKGATPAYPNFSADTNGLTLIPLNMAEPILITRGRNNPNALGFAPHGAGRNYSRTQHIRKKRLGIEPVTMAPQPPTFALPGAGRTDAEIMAEETRGIDARFYCGVPDISELPSAYKNAAAVKAQIQHYGLAEVVDTIEPYGCIMAGDWQHDMPWRNKRAPK